MGFLLDSDIQEICERLDDIAPAFSGKRVLITGARGFLGRYFTDVLLNLNARVLNEPCEIIAIDNLVTAGQLGAELPKEKQVAFVNHDIVKPFYPERPQGARGLRRGQVGARVGRPSFGSHARKG
jgi:UDP-glucuronate decarboxylase